MQKISLALILAQFSYYSFASTSFYEKTVLKDNPILYYRLNDSASTIAKDEIGLGSNGNQPGTYWSAISGVEGVFGSLNNSAYFDGDSDNIQLINPNLPIGSSSRTIEVWVNPSSNSAQMPVIGYGTDLCGKSFILRVDNNKIRFTSYCGTDLFSSTPIPVGKWTHVVITYDGITVQLYVNGDLDSSDTGTIDTLVDPLGLVIGGSNYSSWNNWYDGEIDEISIYNYALTAQQVKKHYISAIFPDPSVSYYEDTMKQNPSLYWRLGEDVDASLAKDEIGTGVNGAQPGTYLGDTTSAFSGIGFENSAAIFDGNSDDIQLTSPNLPIGNSARTVEAWVNPSSNGGQMPVVGYGVDSCRGSFILRIDNNKLRFTSYCGADIYSSSSIPIGKWTHIAASYDGTTVKLYVNGVPDGTSVRSINTIISPLGFVVGGSNYSSWSSWYYGMIDEVAVYNYALSSEEIEDKYNRTSINLWVLEGCGI